MATDAHQALNRVAKWRTLLTGWQLGTRPKGDPEGDAVRDHRESSILLRVEASALAQLLIAKGVFTAEEFEQALIKEADLLSMAYEAKFPGVRASDDGLVMDNRVQEWMKDWKP